MKGGKGGYGASFGNRKPKGGGKGQPQRQSGVPFCSGCHGQHPDVRGCPSQLARQDKTYKHQPGQFCSWTVHSNGQTFRCNAKDHFARHHKQQWTQENPGKQIPYQKGGKGGGKAGGKKGKKGGGKGKYKGKKVIKMIATLEDGTIVPEEELSNNFWCS